MAVGAGMIAVVDDISHDAESLQRAFDTAEQLVLKFHRAGASSCGFG